MGNMQNSRNYIIKQAAELQPDDIFILNYNRYRFRKFIQENGIEDTTLKWGTLGWLYLQEVRTGEDRTISTYSQYPFIVEVPNG